MPDQYNYQSRSRRRALFRSRFTVGLRSRDASAWPPPAMLSWKEKVAAKLSRILADLPSSLPTRPGDYSPIATEDKAMSSQDYSSQVILPFSSNFLPSLNSTSGDADASVPKSPAHVHSEGSLPQKSLPRKWSAKSLPWKKRPSNFGEENGTTECREIPESSKEDMNQFPNRPIDHCSMFVDASTRQDPNEYLSYLTVKSTFMSANLFDFFGSCLPNIVKGCQWILLYSTWKHGISFQTLLRKSADPPGPCLLIVGDMQGAIFGGLLNSPLKPTSKRKYQLVSRAQAKPLCSVQFMGSQDSSEQLTLITGANRFYYLCLNDQLAFGGGQNFALSIEEDLLRGSSGPCETFGNSCLAHNSEFELKNVELWGFAHSSYYLT
ncbi:oxidation resistance protein 1-like isoform X2 [Zingiber officinale]|uniref:oxidation resistance protein 1-like isoform X2 n=1 Tax=Zingiber officinale TaxID=94328 RepID=UPI001C4DCB5E|nr:oxidation resistance protein 1-like isoform X2 [Zingiber officinale]